jgi:hypothetical protein
MHVLQLLIQGRLEVNRFVLAVLRILNCWQSQLRTSSFMKYSHPVNGELKMWQELSVGLAVIYDIASELSVGTEDKYENRESG